MTLTNNSYTFIITCVDGQKHTENYHAVSELQSRIDDLEDQAQVVELHVFSYDEGRFVYVWKREG